MLTSSGVARSYNTNNPLPGAPWVEKVSEVSIASTKPNMTPADTKYSSRSHMRLDSQNSTETDSSKVKMEFELIKG